VYVTFDIRLDQLRGNIHTSGALKNNNHTTTTPIFVGLNKTMKKKKQTSQEEISIRKIKSDVLKQMYFSVNYKMQ
jgi:hypothetical protein